MKYRANPVLVDAFQIAHVGRADTDGGRKIYHSEGSAYANAELLARIEPEPGDYWVVQADGYCYLNPRDVFERKYAAVEPRVASRMRPIRILAVIVVGLFMLYLLFPRLAGAAVPPVQIRVGAGKTLTVVFPRMNKLQLSQIAAVALAKGDDGAAMMRALSEASQITVVMTTEER